MAQLTALNFIRFLADLEDEEYARHALKGDVIQDNMIRVFDPQLRFLTLMIDYGDHYQPYFFGGMDQLTQQQFETYFAGFPQDKGIKARLHTRCAYLIKFPGEAETVLDAWQAAYPNDTVVKTLSDPKVKGTVNV